jgi:ABC-type multidrug transport system ATPase subunit
MNELKFNKVSVSFNDTNKVLLTDVEVTFRAGINYLIGINGVGKSSFLKALSGLYPNLNIDGEIKINESNFSSCNLGIVTQNPDDSIILDLTFLENLLFSGLNQGEHLSLKRLANPDRVKSVMNYLDSILDNKKLSALLKRPAYALSGGEKQLLSILMRNYRGEYLLLLDEATSNLDHNNSKMIMNLIKDMGNRGKIILFVTHQSYLTKEYPGWTYQILKKKILKKLN